MILPCFNVNSVFYFCSYNFFNFNILNFFVRIFGIFLSSNVLQQHHPLRIFENAARIFVPMKSISSNWPGLNPIKLKFFSLIFQWKASTIAIHSSICLLLNSQAYQQKVIISVILYFESYRIDPWPEAYFLNCIFHAFGFEFRSNS